MIKNRHLPEGLRDFNGQFSQLARKYDASRVFDDLLSIIICCMCYGHQEEWYHEIIKNYTRKELNIFANLFAHLQIQYAHAQEMGTWTDPLGDFYEELASNSKKSGFGQFFTPRAICDMTAQMILDKNEWGKFINEPCSGSGRMILAANQHAPNNKYLAQDLDPICAKMTAINLCFHKIRAEVLCMDVLRQTEPRLRFIINHDWHKHKTPCIIKI